MDVRRIANYLNDRTSAFTALDVQLKYQAIIVTKGRYDNQGTRTDRTEFYCLYKIL